MSRRETLDTRSTKWLNKEKKRPRGREKRKKRQRRGLKDRKS
jgi:hypothetical protein